MSQDAHILFKARDRLAHMRIASFTIWTVASRRWKSADSKYDQNVVYVRRTSRIECTRNSISILPPPVLLPALLLAHFTRHTAILAVSHSPPPWCLRFAKWSSWRMRAWSYLRKWVGSNPYP